MGEFNRFRFESFHDSEFVSFNEGDRRVLDVAAGNLDALVGSFFQIKLGVNVRDVPRSKLIYVRQDLVELYQAQQNDIDEEEDTRRVYIGNPGTGKSLTALQLLFLLIKLHPTHPVVYYSEKVSQGVYYLFKEGRFHSLLSLNDATEQLLSSDTFYIHDGSKIPDSGTLEARTVLVTSLKPSVYKEFAKTSGGYDAFYGRLWTEEELKACRTRAYPRIKWQTVAQHLYMVGPVPRLVFQSPQKFKAVVRTLKAKLAQTSDLLGVFSSIGPHDMEQAFSHVLLHLDRGKNSTEGYTSFGSDYVKEQLLLRLDKERWLEMIGKYTSLQGAGGLASFRGIVMELLMHITFPRYLGKCARLCGKTHDRHSTAAPVKLDVDEAEDLKVVFYVDFEDLQAKIEKCIKDKCPTAYFWPRTKTEAAIDSIYIDFQRKRAFLLQATVSKTHAVVWHPVKVLLEFLSSHKIRIVGLYFVVSETVFATFKAQRWRKARKLKGSYPELMSIPSLCQYKVEFSGLDDVWTNIERLSDALQHMDDNFKLTLVSLFFGHCLDDFVSQSRENDMPEEHVRQKRKRSSSSSVTNDLDMDISELDFKEVEVAAGEHYQQESEDECEGTGGWRMQGASGSG